jgi:acylphosphatase
VTEAARLLVRGRVQGVGFRWFVRERARELGIRGWVKNRPDGTVEVFAEGSSESIARFREFLAVGPSGAKVSAVEEIVQAADSGNPDPTPSPAGFVIHR